MSAGTEQRPALRARVRAFAGPAGGLRRGLLKAVAGSAGLKAANMLVTSAVAVVLARVLQPEGYGIYAFAMALVSMLGVPSQAGLPTLMMREVARLRVRERWDVMRGLFRRSNQAVIVMSVLVAAGAALWVAVRRDLYDAQQVATLQWALLLLPLTAFGALRSAALRGLGRVVQGQMPEMLLRPLFLLLLVGGLLLAGRALEPSTAMAMNVAAAFLSFLVGALLLRRGTPQHVRAAVPVYESAAWARSIVPLSFLGGFQLLNSQTDILMLGALATPADVGIYRVVVQLAGFVLVGGSIVNAVQAPHLARMYAEEDMDRLHRLARQGSRALFLSAVAIALVLIVGGPTLLRVAFGPEYARGYVPLVIWCIGMVISAEQGSLVTVMNMTGQEGSTARIMAVGAVSSIVLNFIAIPLWGMTGAAAATMTSTVLRRVLMMRQLRSQLGISIGALGSMRAVRPEP